MGDIVKPTRIPQAVIDAIICVLRGARACELSQSRALPGVATLNAAPG